MPFGASPSLKLCLGQGQWNVQDLIFILMQEKTQERSQKLLTGLGLSQCPTHRLMFEVLL